MVVFRGNSGAVVNEFVIFALILRQPVCKGMMLSFDAYNKVFLKYFYQPTETHEGIWF